VAEEIEPNGDRRILGSLTFRPWEDDYFYLEEISKNSGIPVRTLCRDLISEAVRARKQPPVNYEEIMHRLELLTEHLQTGNRRQEEFLIKYDQNEEREAQLKQVMIAQLRRLGGVLAEVLGAAILVKRLIWKYVVYEVLKGLKYPESRISSHWETEIKTSNAESSERLKQVDKSLGNEENGRSGTVSKR